MRNRKEYSEDWTDIIRPRILKRDGYKCTKCGVGHRQYVLVDSSGNFTLISKDEHNEYKPFGAKTYRIYLQIAHVDNNKSNNEDKNLTSVCVRCHAKMDREWKRVIALAEKVKIIKDIGATIVGKKPNFNTSQDNQLSIV